MGHQLLIPLHCSFPFSRHRILINYCINFLHSTCGEISCIQVTEHKPYKRFKVQTSNFWFTNIIILFQFSIIISSPLSVSNVSFLSLNLYCFILAFVASLEEFYHVFENSGMKWKRVCMPNCYNPSVPRKSQSKKSSFLQNADIEINSTMQKKFFVQTQMFPLSFSLRVEGLHNYLLWI